MFSLLIQVITDIEQQWMLLEQTWKGRFAGQRSYSLSWATEPLSS